MNQLLGWHRRGLGRALICLYESRHGRLKTNTAINWHGTPTISLAAMLAGSSVTNECNTPGPACSSSSALSLATLVWPGQFPTVANPQADESPGGAPGQAFGSNQVRARVSEF